MKRRDVLRLGGTLAAGLSAPALVTGRALAQAKPESISVMTWGGLWGDALAKGVDSKFTAATGVKVVQDRGSSPVERITKIKVNAANQIFDCVQLHDGLFPAAIAQGVLEPLDAASPNMPNIRELLPGMLQPYYALGIFSALGLCYNTKEVKSPPTSWADLWRPEFKGRIVLPEISHSIGTYIIPVGALADGKPAGDAEAGFAMFQKLVKLEPIFAKDTDSIMNAMTNGDAVIGLLYKSQTFTVQDRKKEPVEWVFPKEGGISVSWGTGIAKGTKNKELAEKYVNLSVDPQAQGLFSEAFNYPGSHKKMLDMLSPEKKARVQFSDDQLARMIALDHGFMSAERSKWVERWNKVVAGG